MSTATTPLRVLVANLPGPDTAKQVTGLLPALDAHPNFRVTTVTGDGAADTAADLGATHLGEAGATRRAVDGHDLVVLSPGGPDWASTALAALRADTAVLLDQPYGADPVDLARVAAQAARTQVPCVPAYTRRHAPAVRAARTALAAGRTGLPWNIQADLVIEDGGRPDGTGDGAPAWLRAAGEAVDSIHSLIGQPVAAVHALATPGDGPGVLLLDHDHGITSTIVAGTAPAAGAGVHRYRISGSHGVLITDAAKPGVLVRNAAGPHLTWDGPDAVTTLLDDLHAALLAGRPAGVGPADALHTAQVLAAARASLAAGRPAPVDALPVHETEEPA